MWYSLPGARMCSLSVWPPARARRFLERGSKMSADPALAVVGSVRLDFDARNGHRGVRNDRSRRSKLPEIAATQQHARSGIILRTAELANDSELRRRKLRLRRGSNGGASRPESVCSECERRPEAGYSARLKCPRQRPAAFDCRDPDAAGVDCESGRTRRGCDPSVRD